MQPSSRQNGVEGQSLFAKKPYLIEGLKEIPYYKNLFGGEKDSLLQLFKAEIENKELLAVLKYVFYMSPFEISVQARGMMCVVTTILQLECNKISKESRLIIAYATALVALGDVFVDGQEVQVGSSFKNWLNNRLEILKRQVLNPSYQEKGEVLNSVTSESGEEAFLTSLILELDLAEKGSQREKVVKQIIQKIINNNPKSIGLVYNALIKQVEKLGLSNEDQSTIQAMIENFVHMAVEGSLDIFRLGRKGVYTIEDVDVACQKTTVAAMDLILEVSGIEKQMPERYVELKEASKYAVMFGQMVDDLIDYHKDWGRKASYVFAYIMKYDDLNTLKEVIDGNRKFENTRGYIYFKQELKILSDKIDGGQLPVWFKQFIQHLFINTEGVIMRTFHGSMFDIWKVLFMGSK